MYFIKQQLPTFKSDDESSYQLFAECSKGRIWLRPSPAVPNNRPAMWVWRIEQWTFKFDKRAKQVKKTISYATGCSSTLYLAAKRSLQRIFSQRPVPVYELITMLVNDQAMHELGKIGT